MFVGPEHYKDCLAEIVAEEGSLDMAIAFWGAGADRLISASPKTAIRIICNLASGGTNPVVIASLLEMSVSGASRVTVLQCDNLHAKVVIGSDRVLIGSANLSANGLGLEGRESAFWLEAAIHTTNEAEVASARLWFNDLWGSHSVRAITARDLEHAKAAWEKSRATRPNLIKNRGFNILDYSQDDLADRPAYLLIHRSPVTAEAEAQAEQAQAENQGDQAAASWGFIEAWPSVLDTTGSVDYLIALWDDSGAVQIDAVNRTFTERRSFPYSNAEDGIGWIDLTLPRHRLFDRAFGEAEQETLTQQLERCMDDVWAVGEGNEWAKQISLSDLGRIIHRRTARDA